MKSALLLSLPTLGLALPGLLGADSKEDVLRQLQKREEFATQSANLEGRQLLSTVLGDVAALTGSVASSVDEANKRPEPGYEFQAPGPNDSRGPCPGLNLLANHGYLPRNGKVSLAQVVEATARGFNMGADLSTILSVFAVLSDGDIESETWYLGRSPDKLGGLNRHDTVEADISPNREDYYTGCGDAHHLSSRLFRQNVGFAKQSTDKQFSLDVMGEQYSAIAAFSQKHNPYLYYFPFPSIVSLGAFVFYPNFFSNGTYGDGGVANYESISSIIGAKLNKKTGQFEYVPERWPEQGWYRRSTEYGAIIVVEQALQYCYAKHPVGMPIAQLGTSHLSAKTVLCNVFDGIQSITPIALAGQEEGIAEGITWALTKLGAVGLSKTVLGCPKSNTNANELYPNATQKGGPLNPPPHVKKNAGNNVYGKSYFCKAPTSPNCSPEC